MDDATCRLLVRMPCQTTIWLRYSVNYTYRAAKPQARKPFACTKPRPLLRQRLCPTCLSHAHIDTISMPECCLSPTATEAYAELMSKPYTVMPTQLLTAEPVSVTSMPMLLLTAEPVLGNFELAVTPCLSTTTTVQFTTPIQFSAKTLLSSTTHLLFS